MADKPKRGTAIAEPEDDDLLPGGPIPDGEPAGMHELIGEPPSVDAFVGEDGSDTPAEDVVEYVRAEDAPDEPADNFDPIALGFAQLQDLKVSAAKNGNNYLATFEVDIVHLDKMSRALRGGHDITWKKIAVGQGAEVERVAITHGQDRELHLKLFVKLPSSEVSRSLGRLGPNVAASGELLLEPMQGTLNLPGGKVVDLRARA